MITRIFLHDEIVAFGSGWRNVEVVRLGYKWVAVRCAGRNKRIKRKLWDKLTAEPEPKKRKRA